MRIFKVTFETGSVMEVKAVSDGNAREVASYFRLNRGKVVKVELA